jgi:hypothetical protein
VVTADDVREVGLALPRAYERMVRGRWKLRVGQIVFCAFSRDETQMGFGFPKAERDGLIASDPETFFLPPASDLRYQWVCAHLGRLELDEMRELVVDAWRMCTPAMLHDLPELPAPAAAAWAAMDQGEWGELRPLLHPSLHFEDGRTSLRGRARVLAHLQAHPTAKPPRSVELRDGRIYRWVR